MATAACRKKVKEQDKTIIEKKDSITSGRGKKSFPEVMIILRSNIKDLSFCFIYPFAISRPLFLAYRKEEERHTRDEGEETVMEG